MSFTVDLCGRSSPSQTTSIFAPWNNSPARVAGPALAAADVLHRDAVNASPPPRDRRRCWQRTWLSTEARREERQTSPRGVSSPMFLSACSWIGFRDGLAELKWGSEPADFTHVWRIIAGRTEPDAMNYRFMILCRSTTAGEGGEIGCVVEPGGVEPPTS